MGKTVARNKRGRSRRRTYLYALIGLAIVSGLIYWEQTALLYVVSTLVVCGLLLTVAFADLEGRDLATEQAKVSEPKAQETFAATESSLDKNTSEVVVQ